MQLCWVEHFYNIFVLTFGRDCYCIQQSGKSEDKYVVKVFNSTELHFFEVYFFQNWYFSIVMVIIYLFDISASSGLLWQLPCLMKCE